MGGITDALGERNNFIPESGYNLVGIDGDAAPGEQLYLIEEGFESRALADAAQKLRPPDENSVVYGPEDRVELGSEHDPSKAGVAP